MLRAIICLTLAVLLLPALALAAPPAPGPSGYMIDNQGKKIAVERYDKLLPKYPFVYQDSEESVPMKDIKSLTLVDEGEHVVIETVSGKQVKVTGQMGICYTDMIAYKTKNPIDGTLQDQTTDPLFITKIIFDWKK
ncbi:MAG: hypothetical protein K9K66_15275 [Desulfarculaceae bacterium]|nr:hypothetical protein [Desulfarculaceae bacterium]MCF8074224.1 hypothetical protein [Desulfarculaceae bacterium]MCF8103017.1 hypothetical protein [Desulfarculaceae bacterium]MCF8117148.1 hypothetical protein [Desulfarculaceae bacterium]